MSVGRGPPLPASQCPLSSETGLTQRARCPPLSVVMTTSAWATDSASRATYVALGLASLTPFLDRHRPNKKISADVMPFTCLFMALRYTSLTSAQLHLPKPGAET